jgi:hypothetical protein
MVRATACLPPGAYEFVLYDAGGDGICCRYGRGEYALALAGRAVRPLAPGGFQGKSEVTPFDVGADDLDVRPAAEAEAATAGSAPDGLSATPTEPCASFSMHLIPDQASGRH